MDAAQQRLEVAPGRAVEVRMGDMRLSRKELAEALGATPRTLERWRAGGTYVQLEAGRRLAELVELNRHLRETFEDREAVRSDLALATGISGLEAGRGREGGARRSRAGSA